VCGPVGTAAALHLAACTPNFKIQEHFNDFADAWVKQAVDRAPEVVAGCFALPEAPGLGVTPDEDFVAAHPRQDARFDLYADDRHRRGVIVPGADLTSPHRTSGRVRDSAE
jgi:galactonate dehydratase